MPDAPNAPRIAVTIPKTARDAARADFTRWGAIASARILGEDDHEIAMYLATVATSTALLGSMRNEIEAHVRKFGGRVGAKDAWVAADGDYGDFLAAGNLKAATKASLDLPVMHKLFLLAAARVAEEDTDRRMEARAVTKRFDFGQDSADWLFEVTENLGSLGLLAPYQRDGGGEDQFVHLTAAGVRKARELSAAGLRVFARDEERDAQPHSDGTFFSDGSGYRTGPRDGTAVAAEDIHVVDSSAWTGVSKPEVVEGEKLQLLRSQLADVERQVDALDLPSNSQRQQVMALVTAMKILADAPEPPADVIRDILQLLNNISGIGSLVVALILLMKG